MKKRKNDKLVYYKSLFKQIPHLENEIAVLDKKIKEAKDNVGSIKSPSDWESIRLENATFNPHDDKAADMVWELTQERHKLLKELERIEEILNKIPDDVRDMVIKIYINRSHSYSWVASKHETHAKQIQRYIDNEIYKL